MAHQVEQMFSVKQTPWHGLGRIVQEAPDAAAAIKLADLDWRVKSSPLYRELNGDVSALESHKLLFREDTGAQLGVVGQGYTPLQNSEAFDFFNPFVESGLASFETAGSLREGKTVWVLAHLNKAPIEIGKGDAVEKFLLLSNGHDGTMAVRVGFTPIRVVCANTLAMAHEGKSSLLRIFHSEKVHERLEKVQEIVNAADAKFEATAEQYRALSKKDVDQKALKKYVNLVFRPISELAERKELAMEEMEQNIIRLFETGMGQDLKGAKGTYWGLYNAVTEYLAYEKGNSEASRLNNLWFGQNKNLNARALEEALVMAG